VVGESCCVLVCVRVHSVVVVVVVLEARSSSPFCCIGSVDSLSV